MMLALSLVLIVVSAIGYRVRGSGYFADLPAGFLFGISRGDRLFKLLIGAAPVGFAACLAGVPWYLALAVWALTALSDTLPHAAFQGAAGALQVLGMSALGIANLAPAAAALWLSGHAWWVPLVTGLLSGPAYLAGNHTPLNVVRGMFALRKGPEVGEFFNGAMRAVFAPITIALF